ncbi:hypothetical protein FC72_GL000538 [Companilactobacillus tucceti DSM 20183]|uniref:Uncharacterized protein n=2 Tax=Companilactobacillus tucceti TaxID=238012 RepID=A0A0R1IZT0_9LACO|nr:hypothetical protein FC72_GL000538 [Companilactobacillus tucceti DSM 20183]
MQLSDFEGNRAYAKTHADDDSVEGLTEFINSLIKNTSNNVDLTDYFTKEEIKQLLSDSIKDSLKDYYTKEEVMALIDNGSSVDLTDYYDKEQVDELIAKIPKVDLSAYYTKTDVDKLIESISKVDFSDYPTKKDMTTAITQAISNVKPDLTSYYTKDETDKKISGMGIPDVSQFMKRDDVIDAINNAIDKKISDYSTTKEMNTAIENATTHTDVYTFNPKSPFSGHGSLIRQGKVVTFQFTGQTSDTDKGMDMGPLPAWARPFEKVSFPVQEMDNAYLHEMVGIGTIGTDGVVWAATNNTSGFINFTISYIGS